MSAPWPSATPSASSSWPMGSWWATNQTLSLLLLMPWIKLEGIERADEAYRSDRACRAQPARISSAKFPDHHRHLGGRGFAGRDALSRHRAATTRIASFDEV